MENMNFLEKVLQGDEEYWVVAKRTTCRHYGETKQGEDEILFVAIPKTIKRNVKAFDLTVREVESIRNTYVDTNVFLSESYSPFQIGQRFGSFYDGFPVTVKGKNFLRRALEIERHDIGPYEDLHRKMIEEEAKEEIKS